MKLATSKKPNVEGLPNMETQQRTTYKNALASRHPASFTGACACL